MSKLYPITRTSGLPFRVADIDALQAAIVANFDKVVQKVQWDGHSIPDKAVFERSDRLLKRTEAAVRRKFPLEGQVALPSTEAEAVAFVKEHGTLAMTVDPATGNLILFIVDSQS